MYKKFIKKLYTFATISVAVASGVQNAQATSNSATGTLQVTANVLPTCTIGSATLAFGNYTSGTTNDLNAQTNVVVTCGLGLAYKIKFNNGLNQGNPPGSSYSMKSGSSYLRYAISNSGSPSASSTWPSAGVSRTGIGNVENIPVYGMIPSGQIIPGGSYADTITMTVEF